MRTRYFGVHFDAMVHNMKVHDLAVLDGYWQSERYFADIADKLRSEFEFKTEVLQQTDEELAKRIAGCESVAVHCRRLHGITSQGVVRNAVPYHGSCPISYYELAASRMHDVVREPQFFLFADDPQWADENLAFISPRMLVRKQSSTSDHEHLYLMSLCKHHIIANSTFSWWGAWLGVSEGKMVIAPKQWFGGGRKAPVDLLPDGWHAL